MIISVEGKLGSGKTYWCVKYLLEKFYSWNDAIDQYVPRYTDLRIISNIDGLSVPHEDLKGAIDEKGISVVFSEEYVAGSAHCIYVIDEAQNLFDRRFSNKGVFRFFQLSRHWGVDILLITQDVDTLAKELRALCEYTVKAYPRSRSMSGVMRYGWLSEGEVFKTQTYRYDRKVGMMYQSRTKKETMRMPLSWRRYAVMGLVMLVVSGVGLVYGISRFYPDSSSPKGSAIGARSAEQGSASASGAMEQYAAKQKAAVTRIEERQRQAVMPAASSPRPRDGEEGTDARGGMKREIEIEREPLVPARCYEELDGWRVCFEGAKPIGRYKVHNQFHERNQTMRGSVEHDEKYMGRELTVLR